LKIYGTKKERREVTEERLGIKKINSWKTRRERPLGRPGHKWEDNIEVDFEGRKCERVDWVQLVRAKCQWRAVVTSSKQLNFIKGGGIFESLSDY
jgi:hypothetical protein